MISILCSMRWSYVFGCLFCFHDWSPYKMYSIKKILSNYFYSFTGTGNYILNWRATVILMGLLCTSCAVGVIIRELLGFIEPCMIILDPTVYLWISRCTSELQLNTLSFYNTYSSILN